MPYPGSWETRTGSPDHLFMQTHTKISQIHIIVNEPFLDSSVVSGPSSGDALRGE